jgi:uncharacterized membrane protein YfcA|tara:strand:- start:326 stop:1075 length:750 start_codon:yes stop_codon:yes gene_type:complete
MDIILNYFSSFEIFLFSLLVVFIGAIAQSALGIGFGIPGCLLILVDPLMVPPAIVLMGTFLAFSNAFLSFRDILVKDLFFSLSGRVVGTLISIPLISLTYGTNNFLIIFGLLLLIAIPLTAKKWDLIASAKNVIIAGFCSGFMGTLTGVGGPPMGIVYQNSKSKNVVATLNMFFGFGALFSVIVLTYIGLLNFDIALKCLFLSPSVILGMIFGRLDAVKVYVNVKFKFLILIICTISAFLVLGQALISY